MASLPPTVQRLVSQAALPDQAEHTLLTLLKDCPETEADISEAGIICRAIIAISDISRPLTNAVRRDPSLLNLLKPQSTLETARDRSDYLDILTGQNPDLNIRAWKRGELMRIMVRDVLLGTDLISITGEISALADACLCHCLGLAASNFPGFPVAVLGLGKLGGNELNYASDVDVVFVHGESQAQPLETAQKIARSVISQMSEHTAEGVVFKVDTDLRPEGTSGVLSRTPKGYKDYFEKRARPWERQAWMKARFVAGDQELAMEVLDSAQEFVWRPDLHPEEIRHIRSLKTNVEKSVAVSDGRDYKRGPGGIRDIEFSTQLLLLAYGRSDPMVRSPNTLLALEELKRAGSIDLADAEHFSTAYRYLRTIEHRLQLRDEQAVYEIPSDPSSLAWLARVLGHRDTSDHTAQELFLEQYRRHQVSVRETEQRLFLRPSLEAIAQTSFDPAATNLSQNPLLQLELLGFSDAAKVARICDKLTAGISRTARSLSQMMPLLLSSLAETPAPDLGLIRFDWVTDGPHRANTIIPVLRDSPTSVERLSRLLGSSRVVADDLRRTPGFVRVLAEDDLSRTPESLLHDATAAIALRSDEPEVRRDEVRRFLRRERLRVASRDLLDLADVNQTSRELTGIAEALSEAVLSVLQPEVRFCVLGMGSVGGREMLYTSDLDVLFLFEPSGQVGSGSAQRTAQAWLSEMTTLTPEGRAWEVDVRLRPEGQGMLAHTLEAYQNYWNERARLWEFQALLKARVIAGDLELGQTFLDTSVSAVFAKRSPAETAVELWDMRKRIQAELGKGSLDVKRGQGGRVDVSFAVQLLQLLYGLEYPDICRTNTFEALGALGAAGIISVEETELLQESYLWCSKATNRHFLLTGIENAGLLSDDQEEALLLARLMCDRQEMNPLEQFDAERERLTTSAKAAVEAIFSHHGAGE